MMKIVTGSAHLFLFLTMWGFLCGLSGTTRVQAADSDSDGVQLLDAAKVHLSSITSRAAAANINPAQVSLGRQLFFDPRFSADGVWSCILCHQPSLYGTDAQRVSRGVFDKPLLRNAPTVLNSSLQFAAHWDGKFESVKEQATHALMGPGFGNKDRVQAVARINAIPGYRERFRDAFPDTPDEITTDKFGIAVAAYEQTLLTPSRLDAFLDGNVSSLSQTERSGLALFLDVGCANCHHKEGIGGAAFEKFGEISDYWAETKSTNVDKGRFSLTNRDEDLYVFKVASLRNVERTAPYFHGGSVESLPEAIRVMAKVQLEKDLSPNEISAIAVFLKSLTGTLPDNFATVPVLPPGEFR